MPPADPTALTERLKAQAYGVGFDLAGVAALGVPGCCGNAFVVQPASIVFAVVAP